MLELFDLLLLSRHVILIRDLVPVAVERLYVDSGVCLRIVNRYFVVTAKHNVQHQKIKGAVRANPNDLTGWQTVVPRGKDVTTYCT